MQKVGKRIGFDLTTPWTLFIGPGPAARLAQPTALVPTPTGDGGNYGLSLQLDINTDATPARAVGIAHSGDRLQVSKGFVEEIPLDALPIDIDTSLLEKTFALTHVSHFFAALPESAGCVGILAANDGEKRLIVAVKKDERYVPLAMPATTDSTGPFLLYEHPNPQSDIAPYDSSFMVLPDLDGNGQAEILVLSTASMLLSIEQETTTKRSLTLQDTFYLGP